MEIESPLHALILMDQKIIERRKTRMKSASEEQFLFVRIDTYMYPSIVLEDASGKEIEWDYKTLRHRKLFIIKNEIKIEPFYD
jgi:hypothetical protein